jgi:hypothetical protein
MPLPREGNTLKGKKPQERSCSERRATDTGVAAELGSTLKESESLRGRRTASRCSGIQRHEDPEVQPVTEKGMRGIA